MHPLLQAAALALALLAFAPPAAAQSADLSIVVARVSAFEVTPGGSLTFNGTVEATGSFTGNVRVDLQAPFQAAPLGTAQVFLASAGQAAFSEPITLPASAPVGGYDLVAVVDPANQIAESNEANNQAPVSPRLQVRTANLRVDTLSVPPSVVVGTPFTVQVTLENTSRFAAEGFVYEYVLGTPPSTTTVFTSAPLDLAAGQRVTRQDTLTLLGPPRATTLSAWVNPNVQVPESNLSDNTRSAAVAIAAPRPNLRAELGPVGSMVEVGQLLGLSATFDNDGEAASPPVAYRYYLSANREITGSDRALFSGVTPGRLAAGGATSTRDDVRVPPDTAPGPYFLAVVADPDDAVAETNEGDNVSALVPVEVFPSELVIQTETLPAGAVGEVYEVALRATGAVQPTWSVVSGRLPDGLALAPDLGELFGRPAEAGTFGFRVRATAGGAVAEMDLELDVLPRMEPLAIMTQVLPTGTLGEPYAARLEAAGGLPPYTWSSPAPPPGLGLTRDGRLSGTPPAAGAFPFVVRVEDARARAVSQQLVLLVQAPGDGVRVAPEPLPPGTVGVPYCAGGEVTLAATGGVPPYRWRADSDLPPGLALSEAGTLCGTPERAGRFDVVVRVDDAANAFDTAGLVIEIAAEAPTITTAALPGALLGQAYRATLGAEGGRPPYTWRVRDPSGLPPGLTLDPAGEISGTPAVGGNFAFVVEVDDAAGATDVAPLSIDVRDDAGGLSTDPAFGCACGSTAPTGGLALLLLFGLALARRDQR